MTYDDRMLLMAIAIGLSDLLLMDTPESKRSETARMLRSAVLDLSKHNREFMDEMNRRAASDE